MGNSLYGSVTQGVSHKVRYDIKTDEWLEWRLMTFQIPY